MIREITERIFSQGGKLSAAMSGSRDVSYEHRQQQSDMALAVSDALEAEESLCVEAPTGVGKTLAYLVPAVTLALAQEKPAIVSTHTINLQEQILTHDIPLLEKMLGTELKAVIAKGRTNYLCLRKLEELGGTDQQLLPSREILGELSDLIKWSESTSTGDYSDMRHPVSGQLWNSVCADRFSCSGPQCEFFKNCYLFRARRRISQAQVIITNHALFFVSMAMDIEQAAGRMVSGGKDGQESLLPKPCCVILDEAHTLEDSAASNLSSHAESYTILRLLGRLYSAERGTGLLRTIGDDADRQAVALAGRRAKMFFTSIVQWMEPIHKNPLRYTVPNHIPNQIDESLREVIHRLNMILQSSPAGASKGDDSPDLLPEIQGMVSALAEQAQTLDAFFGMKKENCVYWLELVGREHTDVTFNCVPVNIAPLLRQNLFSCPPVILTSATLAVKGSLDFFLNRIGGEGARTLVLDTPFDYKKQVTLYVAQNMPEPKETDAFLRESVRYLKHFLTQTEGHAFVLFTSYKSLNDTVEALDEFCRQKHYVPLVQGDKLSPRKMIEQFKKQKNAIIFGTSSFWTGVDVPGDALTNVIITKLPFSVPDNPLFEARAELTRQCGGNDFFDYSVPDAILRFRQGFGRLIRTRQDSGIVVILDSRVVTKRYGRMFLDSIPECNSQMV